MIIYFFFSILFSGILSDCQTQPYPLFMQCDDRWGSHKLGTSKTDTICTDGCLISSVSMSLNGRNITISGYPANPGTINTWLTSHGGFVKGDLFVFASIAPFGYTFLGEPKDKDELVKYICSDHVVILNVHNGGHWVLSTGVNETAGYYVNDPYFKTKLYPFDDVVRSAVYEVKQLEV